MNTSDWSRVDVSDEASFFNEKFSSVCFSPSGTLFAARRVWGVRVWNTRDWSVIADMGLRVGPYGRKLAFIDEARIAIAVDGRVQAWQIDSANKRLTLDWESPEINRGAGAMVSDGRFLAAISAVTHGETVEFKVWDLESRKEIASQEGAHRNFAFDLRLSPDNRRIYSAGGDQAIKVWSFPDLKPLDTLLGHGNEVWALDFSSDGKTMVSGGKGGTARLWKTDERESNEPSRLPEKGWVSENGALFLTDSDSGREWMVWDVRSSSLVARFETDGQPLAFQDRESLLFMKWGTKNTDLILEKADMDTGKLNPFAAIEGIQAANVRQVKASSEGHRIALAVEGGFEVWDTLLRRQINQYSFQGEILAFSQSGDRLFVRSSISDGNILIIWKIGDNQAPVEINLTNSQSEGATFGQVFISTLGNTIALSRFNSNSVLLMSVEDGTVIGELIGHTSSISNIVFSPSGRTLITRNASTTRLWNVAVQREIARFDHEQVYLSPRLAQEGRVIGRNLSGSKEYWRVTD